MTIEKMLAATEANRADPVQLLVCADFLEESDDREFFKSVSFALRWMAEHDKVPHYRTGLKGKTRWCFIREKTRSTPSPTARIGAKNPRAMLPMILFDGLTGGVERSEYVDYIIHYDSFTAAVRSLGEVLLRLRSVVCLKGEL